MQLLQLATTLAATQSVATTWVAVVATQQAMAVAMLVATVAATLVATVAELAASCSKVACELEFAESHHVSAACSLVAVAKLRLTIAVAQLQLQAVAATKQG